jgi:cell division protein FtsW (lipid II flippase)
MVKLKGKSGKSKKQSEAAEVSALNPQEKLAQKRKKREARQKLLKVLILSLSFAIFMGIPLGLVAGINVGGLVGLGIPCLILSYSYPRSALWVFLIYMPFSGTIVYTIGQGNPLFQLTKDVFYIPALIGLIQECRRKGQPILVAKELLPTLGLLFFYSLLVLFLVNGTQQFLPYCSDLTERFLPNPAGGLPIRVPCKEGMPFLQGVLGFKVFLGYVPLIFCAYYLIQDKKKLLLLGRVLIVCAIICCVLALIQYMMLKTGRCVGTRLKEADLLFKASLDARCFVGGSVLYTPEQGQIRLPGTFVSPWHWAWFLVGNAAISFAVAFSETSLFWRVGGLVSMTLVFLNAVICGQRLSLALVPTIIFILLILTGQLANFKKFIPIAVGVSLLSLIAFSFINPYFIQERIDSFVGRWNQAPPYQFIQSQFEFAITNSKALGRGLGTGTNSARSFGSIALIETYHPKILFELGWPGLIFFMIFITHLTSVTFKYYRSLKDTSLKSFASSFWVFMLFIGYFPYWYPLDTDPVAIYYWLFAGVILKLPVIDKQEREKLKALSDENLSGKKFFRRKNKQKLAA